MNLRIKTNEILVQDLKQFVLEERRILNLVLHHLREVENRKLHLKLGYPNLYAFCTKELGYSEASSHRRISAMRLIKEIPEVEEKIQSGVLNLSVISKAQTHFRQQKSSAETKKRVLQELEGKSIQASERFLMSLAPQVVPPEHQKVLDEEHTGVFLPLDRETMEKLNRLKAKLSHQNLTTTQIFKMGLDLLLKKYDAPLPPQRSERLQKVSTARYIPKAIKTAISHRDQTCQYKNPQTGRICGSKYYLQHDHIQPLALVGKTELKNLRILCSNHNKLMWDIKNRASLM
ncbi:MAG: HNH endonuclease signature motif containing protein [Bdellovibrionales bacterium]